jgi:ATP-dependent Clp protease ATP-binding subunit ClpA
VFEYFTERAKRAVVASQDEALGMGHDFIGTGHMLLGLAVTEDTVASDVLSERGFDVARARDEAVRLLTAAGVPATGGQATKDALSTLGIDIAEIQRRADDTFGPGAFQYPRPAYTPGAKKALEQTLRESRALDHEHIGTEHILLGLLTAEDAEGKDIAIKVLTALEVDISALRPAVLARLAPQAS